MKKTTRMQSWVLAVLVVVLACGGLACSTKDRSYPTQPAARSLENPETSFVTAAFEAEKGRDEEGGDPESLVVLFIDQSTGNIDNWVWDFGDGTKSTAQNPVHEYRKFGTYAVTLTVSNAISSDSVSDLIALEEPPEDDPQPEGSPD